MFSIDMIGKRIIHVVVSQIDSSRSRFVSLSPRWCPIPIGNAGMDHGYEAYDDRYREKDDDQYSCYTDWTTIIIRFFIARLRDPTSVRNSDTIVQAATSISTSSLGIAGSVCYRT